MRQSVTFILLVFLAPLTWAQESLSVQPKKNPPEAAVTPTPEQLYQRAIKQRDLGNLQQAASDLRAAAQAKPNMLSWQLERSRIELRTNRPAQALAIANQSLPLAKNAHQRAQIHIIRAEAYLATSKYKPSLHACQLAFKASPKGEPHWFLLRSESQRKLGHFERRISDLRGGLKHYPHPTLRSHLADALIDAGQHSEALTIINNELPNLRWQSLWLIKRARAHQATDSQTAAESDLQTALQEIDSRLNPATPDLPLLRQKAQIFLLKNDPVSAEATIKLMQRHNAPPTLIKDVANQLPGK